MISLTNIQIYHNIFDHFIFMKYITNRLTNNTDTIIHSEANTHCITQQTPTI